VTERLGPPDGPRIRDAVPYRDELCRLPAGTRLVRVHNLTGPNPSAWNELRAFGPTSSRFDHHPLPRRQHPTRRIAYAALGLTAFTAAIAEHFQLAGGAVGPLDLDRHHPTATVFDLALPLTLLDLDTGWVTRAGGNQAIRTGPRGVARDWARAIHRHHKEVDGLVYGSTVWGPGRCLALWERATPAFPEAPTATRQLNDPGLRGAVLAAAAELGTYVL